MNRAEMSDSCDAMESRLNERLDGTLSRSERLEVDAHLGECPRCETLAAELVALRQRVRALPRELPPPAGLWAELARELEARPRRLAIRGGWRLPALALGAAAAALLSVAVLVIFQRSGPSGLPPDGAGAAAAPQAAAMADFHAAEARFREAVQELQEALAGIRAALPPEATAAVDDNLRLIDASIREVETLLQEQPQRPEAGHHLLALYRDKLAVLEQAAAWGRERPPVSRPETKRQGASGAA